MTNVSMSYKYSLNLEDFKKIGKGFLIAIGGAALAYFTQVTTDINFGNYTEIAVAISGVIVNFCRKFLTEQE